MFPFGPQARPTPGYPVLSLVARINCSGAAVHLSTSDIDSKTAGSAASSRRPAHSQPASRPPDFGRIWFGVHSVDAS